MREFVFRCDANAKSGLGHFSRSLNLARWLRDHEPETSIRFAGDLNAFARECLASHGFERQDADAPMHGWCVIVDSYDVAAPYLTECHKHFDRVVIFDDYADRDVSPADLVINYSFNAECMMSRYPKAALGIGYFCPKPELVDVRRDRAQTRPQRLDPLVVTLGGTDAAAAALPKLVRHLDGLVSGLEIRVIGPIPHSVSSTRNRIVDVGLSSSLEDHYRVAGGIICAGGVTKYESAFCLVPNATLALNPGQTDEIQGFIDRGLTFPLGAADTIDRPEFQSRLTAFLEDRAGREKQLSRALLEFRTDSALRLVARIGQL